MDGKGLTIIFNTMNRPNLMPKVMRHNIPACGIDKPTVFCSINGGGEDTLKAVNELPFDKTIYRYKENIGNAQSLNLMLRDVTTKYIAILGDDILLRKNWASKAIDIIEKMNNKAGLMGFNWINYRPIGINHEDLGIVEPERVYGSIVFSSEIITQHGYLLELSKYGMWDTEFSDRLRHNGRINGYVKGFNSQHLGVDTDPQYRTFKDHELSIANKNYQEYLRLYPKGQELLWEKRQFKSD